MSDVTNSLMSGGGIGVDYSALRANGARIVKTGGESTGPLALMHMVNESGRFIMQGGQRRSAIWASLNWKHNDIFDFMTVKDWSDDLKALKLKDFNFWI
jgi:ribonucleoside-diphosphate reductase alpha chain